MGIRAGALMVVCLLARKVGRRDRGLRARTESDDYLGEIAEPRILLRPGETLSLSFTLERSFLSAPEKE